jgi:hypothetical protein
MTARSAVTRGVIVSAVVFSASTLVLVVMAAAPGTGKAAAAATQSRSEKLDAPHDIEGVPCAKRVSYDAGGRLKTCTLARDWTFVNGLQLPKGSQVSVDAQLRPETVFLPSNTVLDGHLCAGDGSHDAMTNFHPNGRLRFCNLAEPQTIQGIPCQKSTFWIWVTQGGAGTYFHDNGMLKQCLLADDVTIEGRTFKKKQHIALDREGRPAGGRAGT